MSTFRSKPLRPWAQVPTFCPEWVERTDSDSLNTDGRKAPSEHVGAGNQATAPSRSWCPAFVVARGWCLAPGFNALKIQNGSDDGRVRLARSEVRAVCPSSSCRQRSTCRSDSRRRTFATCCKPPSERSGQHGGCQDREGVKKVYAAQDRGANGQTRV